MTRSVIDLSWDEIDAIARAAGAAAVDETVKAGISTFGVVDGKAIQVTPDGRIHDLGPADELGDAFADAVPMPKAPAKRASRSRTGKSVRKPSSRNIA